MRGGIGRWATILIDLLIVLSYMPPGVLAVLKTPQLLSPENDSWVNDNTPLFDWTDVTDATSYQILVDNDPDFTSPEINDFPTTSEYEPTVELEEGIFYYWEVRARNEDTGDSSNWSEVWCFRVDITPPLAPSLISPDNSVTLWVDQPTFSWSEVSDLSGITYRLEIDNDPNFSSPAYSILLTVTTHQLENKLVENFSPYYWRVTAVDGAGNENSSVVYKFNLKVPPASSVDPISPYWENSAFTVTMSASDNDGTVENVELWYRYSSDNTNWGDWILYDNDSTPPHSLVFSPPSGDGYYEFYSRAWDDRGNYENAPAQADARCGYDTVAPPAPENLLPENNADLVTPTPTLEWSRVSDMSGVKYEVLVDNDNLFEPPWSYQAENLAENTVTTSPLAPGLYYWKVRARDGAGNYGAWSEVYQFYVRAWRLLEDFNACIQTLSGWRPTEALSCGLSSPASWIRIEALAGGIAPTWWKLEESCCTTETLAGWKFVGSLQAGVRALLPSWVRIEQWSNTVKSVGLWNLLHSISSSVHSIPVAWRYLEGCSSVTRTLPQLWYFLGCYQGGCRAPAGWFGVEEWLCHLNFAAHWLTLTQLSASPSAPASWRPTDTLTSSTQTRGYWRLQGVWSAGLPAPVPSPRLTSPENSANLSTNSPLLCWENLLPADNYHLQVDNEPNFDQPEVDVWLTENSHQPTLPDGVYYWRVMQTRNSAASEWSSVFSFRLDTVPPPKPTLLFPANQNINDNTPLFRWTSVPENSLPLSYWIEIDNEPAFNPPKLLSTGWLWDNYYQLTTELSDGEYYWRVKVRDNAGNLGDWSSENFRVDTVRPSAPAPISPTSNAWASVTPTFTWQRVSENSFPVKYRVFVCEDSGFDTSVYKVYVSPWLTENEWTSPVLVEGLGVEGKLFYWRVCALDNAGNLSENSPIQVFRTDNVPPSVPDILAPENCAYVSEVFTLAYTASDGGSGVASYWVQVMDENGEIVYENQEAENRVVLRLSEGTYQWRVRARDAIGNLSDWSALYTFTVSIWRFIESWSLALGTPRRWHPIESFSASSEGRVSWRELDTWVASALCPAGWVLSEGVSSAVGTRARYLQLASLTATVAPKAGWASVATFSSSLSSPGSWELLDSRSAESSAPSSWVRVEQMISSLAYPTAWRKLETYSCILTNMPGWRSVEDITVLLWSPSFFRFLDSYCGKLAGPVRWWVLSAQTSGARTVVGWAPVELVSATCNTKRAWTLVGSYAARTSAPAVWKGLASLSAAISAPIPTPTLVSPADGTNINPNLSTLTLRWENSLSADNFDLQIDNNADFSSPEVSVTVTGNKYSPADLPDNLYWWRVRQRRTGSVSGWSGAWKFRVDTLEPSPPEPLSPIEGENLNDPIPVLEWSEPPENSLPLTYKVQVATSRFFESGTILRETWVSEPRWEVSPALPDNVYYWRVLARDNAGNNSLYSEVRSFRVDTLSPPAPTLVEPENDSWAPGDFRFSWTSIPENSLPVVYNLVIAYDSDFSEMVENVFLLENTYSTSLAEGSYWWKVRARDNAGNWSEWSDAWTFTLDNTPPSQVVLTRPENSSFVQSGPVTFGWQSASDEGSGVGRYWIQIWRNGSLVYENCSVPDNSLTVEVPTGLYWWRVRAVDVAGNAGGWSEPFVFTSSDWHQLESWQLPLVAPASWKGDESWTVSALGAALWRKLEISSARTSSPGRWELSDSWVTSMCSPSAWYSLDGRSISIVSPVAWKKLENWIGSCALPALWHLTEILPASLKTVAHWLELEAQTGTCHGLLGKWRLIDQLQGTVLAPAFWLPLMSIQSQAGAVSNWQKVSTWPATIGGPIHPPVLIAPENTNTNDNTPTFQWDNLQPVDNFEFMLDNDADFSSPEVHLTTSDKSYTSGELPDGVYWWRVRCWRTGTAGGWSEVRYLRVDTVSPSSPDLLSPSDGEDVSDSTPVLSWSSPPENSLPLTYNLKISTSPYFEPENIVIDVWVEENSYEVSGLDENGVYYWKVCARDNAGNTGPFTPYAWRFHIDTTPPASPSLLSPENRGWAKPEAELSWQEVPENSPPVLYLVQISDFPDFLNTVREVKTYDNSWTVSPPLPVSSYYWRVKARDNAGNWSEWSEVWWFKVDNEAPSKPSLITPENGSHVQANAPFTLTFTASDGTGSGVAYYQVQIDNDPAFPAPLIDVTVSDNSCQVSGLAWGTYYWRVRAIDNVSNVGPWSDPYILYSSDWKLCDRFSVTARGRVSWVLNERLAGRVGSPANWFFCESRSGGIENVARGWFFLESWANENAVGVHYWALVERWTNALRAYSTWKHIDVRSSRLLSPPTYWLFLERVTGELEATLGWWLLEDYAGALTLPAGWEYLENWNSSLTGVHYWVLLDEWRSLAYHPLWRTLDVTPCRLNTRAEHYRLEDRSGYLGVPSSAWRHVETEAGGCRWKPAHWTQVERIRSRSVPAFWRLLERFRCGFGPKTGWLFIEKKILGIRTPATRFHTLESLRSSLFAPHIWSLVDRGRGEVYTFIHWKAYIRSAYIPRKGWFVLELKSCSVFAPRYLEERKEREVSVTQVGVQQFSHLSASAERAWCRVHPPHSSISVGESKYLPPWLPSLPGELCRYIDVKLKNCQLLKLRIRVSKAWLKKMDRNTLRVWGYKGEWVSLPFELAAEDELYLYLEFESQGFSCFAVTARRKPFFPWWAVLWVWLGIVGTLGYLMLQPFIGEIRLRRLQQKYEESLKGATYRKIASRLRSIGRKLSKEDRIALREIAEELRLLPPPTLVPVEEKLTKPELIAVETLEKFIRERRKRIPLRREKLEELKKLQREMLRRPKERRRSKRKRTTRKYARSEQKKPAKRSKK